MRIPESLKINDAIGFVAPSFGCNIEPYQSAFKNAQKKFIEKGYTLNLDQTVMKVRESESVIHRKNVDRKLWNTFHAIPFVQSFPAVAVS